MDPNETWNELIEAIIARSRLDARMIASDLLTWLDRGGFPPSVSLQRVSPEWQTMLCRRICQCVIAAPTEFWSKSNEC